MDTARGRFGEDFQKLRCQSPADVIIQSDGHQCLFSLLSHSSFSISTTDTHLFVHVIFSRAKMDKRVHCSCWIQSSSSAGPPSRAACQVEVRQGYPTVESSWITISYHQLACFYFLRHCFSMALLLNP
ncbi:uncharacterized protein LOC144819585 isoform X1 [Lissotriton helveticus]